MFLYDFPSAPTYSGYNRDMYWDIYAENESMYASFVDYVSDPVESIIWVLKLSSGDTRLHILTVYPETGIPNLRKYEFGGESGTTDINVAFFSAFNTYQYAFMGAIYRYEGIVYGQVGAFVLFNPEYMRYYCFNMKHSFNDLAQYSDPALAIYINTFDKTSRQYDYEITWD